MQTQISEKSIALLYLPECNSGNVGYNAAADSAPSFLPFCEELPFKRVQSSSAPSTCLGLLGASCE